ncbi:MAG: S-layer homology domain-containing protein [Faecousia sp.]
MKKRLICLLVCAALLVSCIPAVSAYYNVSSWAQESVDSMYGLGFLPDSLKNADLGKNITRGQMCQMAVLVYNQLMGTPDIGPDSTKNFTDTSDPAINYAYEQGIVGGYGDGTFHPNDPLTRQDFFKITYNLMATAYWDPKSITPDSLSRFTDVGSVSDYALDATRAMVAIGVVKGSGTTLEPKNNTSAEEAILMFFRAYLYMCDWINQQTEATKNIAIQSQGYSGISTWAIREVQEMQEKGMIPSCLDNCDMSKPITRAQMCAIAVLAYNKAMDTSYSAQGSGYFTDSNDPAVNAAYELGIVGGMGDGTFAPNATLTREQFFKIMANFMSVLGYPRDDSRAITLSKFNDDNRVASWAQAPARLMVYIGAVRGDGKNLNPQDSTAIQEAIAVFLRCYKYTVAWKNDHPNGEEPSEQPSVIDDLLAFAKSFEGYPYVYGGNGPNSFDCSGFVLYVYKHFGYSFSRGAQEQYKDGMHVDMDDLLPGDLVFFSSYGNCNASNSSFRSITHVGLYLGNGYFIHASNPTRGVVIDTLWSGYYNSHFWAGCRIITE